MSTIKFEIALDANNLSMLLAASKFFAELAKIEQEHSEALQPLPEKKTRTRAKPPTKEEPTKEEPTKEEPTKEEPTKEEPTKEEIPTKEEASRYTASDLRKKLGEIATKNPEFIKTKAKAKITELGAPNVSKLDPSKYEEFMDFLNTSNG